MVRNLWIILGLVLLVAGCQTTYQGAGSGEITFSSRVEARFQRYLADPTASYFAVSTDGQSSGYSICSADVCTEPMGTVALRACHGRSKGVPCKIYAMGDYIVWQGAKNTGKTETNITTVVGRGPINIRHSDLDHSAGRGVSII